MTEDTNKMRDRIKAEAEELHAMRAELLKAANAAARAATTTCEVAVPGVATTAPNAPELLKAAASLLREASTAFGVLHGELECRARSAIAEEALGALGAKFRGVAGGPAS